MRRFEHGGDTYGLPGVIDFSASLNPLGMPAGVRAALHGAVDSFQEYPDPLCRDLVSAIARWEGVPAAWVLACAGATDAITRVCQAVRPTRALVCAPGYSGYEQALAQVGAQVTVHHLLQDAGFSPDAGIADSLEGIDAAFIANPNNPTGIAVERALLERIAEAARAAGTVLVLDESFLFFTGETGAVDLLGRMPKLVVMKSLTKAYALAGLRLGYLLCAEGDLLAAFREAGQMWAVSTPAQVAGVAALAEPGYAERSRAFVAEQRAWLARELRGLGLAVLPSCANYLLLRCERPLRDLLLERGILVRRCGDFAGLDGRWFRVAVRTAGQNRQLVRALEEVLS